MVVEVFHKYPNLVTLHCVSFGVQERKRIMLKVKFCYRECVCFRALMRKTMCDSDTEKERESDVFERVIEREY